MKVLFLIALSAIGLWYNWRAATQWWAGQKTHLPKTSDVMGWASVGFSVVWYFFVFAFFIGLTVNNTIFR